jgi:hypothetical protein
MRKPTPARAWAYTGAIVGAGVSVAANVLHSYVPPVGVAPGWHPATGAVVGAVFWPLALLVAIEIFARWHPTRRSAKWLRVLGLVPVAVVAAVVSYRHMSGLLAYWHEDPVTVYIGPLAVDGLMTMAASALIETSNRRSWLGPLWVDGPPTPPSLLAGHTAGMVRDVTPPPAPAGAPRDLPTSPPPPPPPASGARPPAALRLVEQPAKRRRGGQLGSAYQRGGLVEQLRQLRVENPDHTQAQIASQAGVSKRTAARYWEASTPPTNGAQGGSA